MITFDTSIWIDHLVRPDEHVSEYLEAREVLIHPHVIGEIALGNLRNRSQVLRSLGELPGLRVANSVEVLAAIERNAIAGSGIGYVDANLVASCLLTQDCKLWTRDRRLKSVVERLGLAPKLH